MRALVEMGQDAVLVSPLKPADEVMVGWDPPQVIDKLVKREGLPYVKECRLDADVVITTQGAQIIHQYTGLKGRMMYGMGLVPPSEVDEPGMPFDFHLVHGPLSEEVQFRYHGRRSPDLPRERVRQIGYPRLDAYWRLSPSKSNTILYLPTWGEFSSIDAYADEIAKLSGEYNIVVKPHHGTFYYEPERMAKLRSSRMMILDFTDPPEQAYADCAIVLADIASGAFTEAILLQKAVVGLGDPKTLLCEVPPEMRCFAPSLIGDYVRQAKTSWNPELRSGLFATSEGSDGQKAAHAIMEMAGIPRIKKAIKTLLLGAGSQRTKLLFPDGNREWGELTTLDINPSHEPSVVWDLEFPEPLPFSNGSFDEIHAYEILEHIGNQGDYQAFFRQFYDYWRVLKPGGFFCATVPRHDSEWAWGDPSHKRVIPSVILVFLSQVEYKKQIGKTSMSDFRSIWKGDFNFVARRNDGDHFMFCLQAVKPARI